MTMTILKLNSILPKGITAEFTYNGTATILQYRVRYMHNGERKHVGFYKRMDQAVNALAQAKHDDIVDSLPDDWSDMEMDLMESVQSDKQGALEDAIDLLANGKPKRFGMSKQQAFELLDTIPPHELSSSKDVDVTDPETGEIIKVPKHMVAAYIDNMYNSPDPEVDGLTGDDL